MFCYKCGKENSDDSKFCYNCGTSLEKYLEQNEVTANIESKNEEITKNQLNSKRLVISSLVIAIFAVASYFSFFRTITIHNANVGDVVVFGTYYSRIPIKWRVLEVQPYKKLLLSEKGIGSNYSIGYDNNWEKSNARAYLNGSFYEWSFSGSEKLIIDPVWNYVEYGSYDKSSEFRNPYAGTNDKVFLLSTEEAKKYFKNNEDRICKPIEYDRILKIDETTGTCSWFLRSPGKKKDYISRVLQDGTIDTEGLLTSRPCLLRPAIWVIVEKK